MDETSETDLPRVRERLREQAELDQNEQDTELMRLCCSQLFNAGRLGYYAG